MPNNSPQKHLKLFLKKAIHKTTEATGDWIDNKTIYKITIASRSLPQNNLETVTNEPDKQLQINIKTINNRDIMYDIYNSNRKLLAIWD